MINDSAWVIKANLAPGLQSSPISLGNTIVFSPHGIQVMIRTMGASQSRCRPRQRKYAAAGITASLSAQKIYAVLLSSRSLKAKVESVIPVKSMLKGPTQADAEETAVVSISGSFH